MNIHFKVFPELSEFSFNPAREEGLTFDPGQGQPVINIKPAKPESDPFGNRSGVTASVTHSVPASPLLASCVQSLIDRQIDPTGPWPVQIPLSDHGRLAIDSDGKVQEGQVFWFEWLPEDLQVLLDDTIRAMWLAFERFIGIFRWTQGQPLPPPQPPNVLCYWRVQDAGLYHLVPRRGASSAGPAFGGFEWTDADRAVVSRLWTRDALQAPLAHELHNEALLIQDTSPRSSLLMSVSALEVGVKTHIARMAPATEWILLKTPAPPVAKMLREYLPQLHMESERGVAFDKLKDLFRSCQIMIEDRNKLAHGGVDPAKDDVDTYRTVVSDVLYILDYLEGHDWAMDLVSARTLKALGWKPSERHKGKIAVTWSTGPDTNARPR